MSPASAASPLPWRWLGRLDYRAGTAMQRDLRDSLVAGEERAASILLLEHDPVITLGRHARPDHLLHSREQLQARGIEVCDTDRGGDVTYHGPGQLMVYPVIRLRHGLVPMLEAIAQVLANLAADLGVPGAAWRLEPAGLWLGHSKLAACGVHLHRWVTSHGYAFNVATPEAPWQLIVPCGLTTPVTSLAQERAARGLPPPPSVAEVAQQLGPRLATALAAHHRPAQSPD